MGLVQLRSSGRWMFVAALLSSGVFWLFGCGDDGGGTGTGGAVARAADAAATGGGRRRGRAAAVGD